MWFADISFQYSYEYYANMVRLLQMMRYNPNLLIVMSKINELSAVEAIRQIRLYRRYSQDYIAAKLQITQNAYSKIEHGRSTLSLRNFIKISEILEVESYNLLKYPHTMLIKLLSSGLVKI